MKFETAVKKIEAGLGDGGANAKQSISALFSEAIASSEKKPVVEAAAALVPNTSFGTYQHQQGNLSGEIELWANIGNRRLKRTEAQAALRMQTPPPTYKYNGSTNNVIVFADGKNLHAVLTAILGSNAGSAAGGSSGKGDPDAPSVPILPKMRFTNYSNGSTVYARQGNDGDIGFTPEIIQKGQIAKHDPYNSFIMLLLKLLTISEENDYKAWSVNELLEQDYKTYINYLSINIDGLRDGFSNALNETAVIKGTKDEAGNVTRNTEIDAIKKKVDGCSDGQALADVLAECPVDYINFGGTEKFTAGTRSTIGGRYGRQGTYDSPKLSYPRDASAAGYVLSSFFNMLATLKSGRPNFSIIDRVGFVPATDADDKYREELYNQTNFSGLANSGWGKFGKALLSVRGADFNLMQA